MSKKKKSVNRMTTRQGEAKAARVKQEQAAQEATKKANRIKMAVAAAVVAVAGGGIYLSQKSEAPQKKPVVSETSNKTPDTSTPEPSKITDIRSETALLSELMAEDTRIEQIEHDFTFFASKIAAEAPKYADAEVSKALRIPLEVVEGNKENQTKNLRAMKIAAMNGPEGAARFKLLDPGYLFYFFDNLPQGMGAAFRDVSREVDLSKEFDTKRLTDMILLFHEFLHAKEDEERRARVEVDMPNYPKTQIFLVQSGMNAVILEDEARAHMMTIEALNVLFEGRLRELGRDAKTEDLVELLKKYQGSDQQLKRIDRDFCSMLAAETREYYGEGGSLEKLTALVGAIHQSSGFTLFHMTPDGGLTPVTQKYEIR